MPRASIPGPEIALAFLLSAVASTPVRPETPPPPAAMEAVPGERVTARGGPCEKYRGLWASKLPPAAQALQTIKLVKQDDRGFGQLVTCGLLNPASGETSYVADFLVLEGKAHLLGAPLQVVDQDRLPDATGATPTALPPTPAVFAATEDVSYVLQATPLRLFWVVQVRRLAPKAGGTWAPSVHDVYRVQPGAFRLVGSFDADVNEAAGRRVFRGCNFLLDARGELWVEETTTTASAMPGPEHDDHGQTTTTRKRWNGTSFEAVPATAAGAGPRVNAPDPGVQIWYTVGTGLQRSGQTLIAAEPLRGGELGRTPPRAAGSCGAASFGQPFANDERNSRLAARLPAGAWKVRWRSTRDVGDKPGLLLEGDDRVVVIGELGPHSLLSRDGQTVAQVGGGNLPLVASDKGLLFLAGDGVRAWKLSDGTLAFEIGFVGTGTDQVMSLRGPKLLVGKTAFGLHPHGGVVADRAQLVVNEIVEPVHMADRGPVKDVKPIGQLHIESSRTVMAAHADAIVVACPGRIVWLNFDFSSLLSYQAEFEPISMSLDELGRAHLVVRVDGKPRLWVVTKHGSRILDVALPESPPKVWWNPAFPPAIGFDHKMYVSLPDRIVCLDASGKPKWQHIFRKTFPTGGEWVSARYGGLVVTGDDSLLVAEGDQVLAFGSDGKARLLHRFAGEWVRGAPVLTKQGELLVATEAAVYALAPVGP